MTDLNQLDIPPSFVALYVAPGQIKPSLSRPELLRRYELCEDLALTLSENARNLLFDLGIAEPDVLHRFYLGLVDQGSGLSKPEAGWVIRRLTEQLQWPAPLADFVDS